MTNFREISLYREGSNFTGNYVLKPSNPDWCQVGVKQSCNFCLYTNWFGCIRIGLWKRGVAEVCVTKAAGVLVCPFPEFTHRLLWWRQFLFHIGWGTPSGHVQRHIIRHIYIYFNTQYGFKYITGCFLASGWIRRFEWLFFSVPFSNLLWLFSHCIMTNEESLITNVWMSDRTACSSNFILVLFAFLLTPLKKRSLNIKNLSYTPYDTVKHFKLSNCFPELPGKG